MSFILCIPEFSARFRAAGEPRLPALEKLLARSTHLPDQSLKAFLAPHFGLKPETLSEAPFTRLADGGEADVRYWLRADPVHLAPDRDQLVLLPESLLQVEAGEAAALSASFNALYGPEGWKLEFPKPTRGYLSYAASLSVTTHDPALLAGGPVLDFMPEGTDGLRLKRLMNETQMLFHDHAVNRAREAVGEPLINSLWFWGGGVLPPKTGLRPAQIISDLPLVQGLSLWSGSEPLAPHDIESVTADALVALAGHKPLVLEHDWFAPSLARLWKSSLPSLDLYLGGVGAFRVDSAGVRRFWKRGRAISALQA